MPPTPAFDPLPTAAPAPDEDPVLVRSALAACGIGLFEHDLESGQVRLCQQARRIWGWDGDGPITAAHLGEHVFPDERSRATYLSASPPGPSEQPDAMIEHRIVRGDGAVRWLRVHACVVPGLTPGTLRPARLVGTMADVTEEVGARQVLLDAQAQCQAAMMLSPLIPWAADAQGMQHDYSPRWLALTGLTEEQAHTDGWREALHPDDRATMAAAWQRSVATGEPYGVEYRLRAADGRYHWMRSQAQPQRDPSGTILRWYGTSEDIDVRKRARDALRDNEARYRAALATPDMILATCDASLRYTWVHHTIEDLAQLRGLDRTDVEILDNPGTRALMALKRRVLEGPPDQIAIRETISFPLPSGERSFEIVARAIVDAATGVVTGVATAALDVTALKQAQQQVARSADTFRNLLRNNPFGVYVVDADLKLQEASRGAASTGGLADPVPGCPLVDVLQRLWPAAVVAEILERVCHTLATGEPYVPSGLSHAHGHIGKDNSYDWRIERIVLPDGKYGVACYFYDLSEQRRWEVHLEEADRRKDAFLATLSHELRNPLAPIRNAARLLSSPQLPPEQVRWASAVIQRQVSHMAWLLDDLLDLARVTQGKLPLRRTQVSLATVVDTAVETVRPLIDSRRQRLEIDLPEGLPAFEADPLRLSQVLSNLLTNAAKYTDPEGRIALAARIDHDTVEITVADTGIGIAPESLEKVFEMFAQVDHGDRRTEGGLGIGLALVRGLVGLHGGTIEARSAGPGHGSTFIVRLPLTGTDAGGATDAAPQERPAVTPTAARRVLVVDDNRDGADSLAMWLQTEGHQVRVAYGGQDALAAAQGWQPEVVLLDIGMPGFDGYETARALRKLPGGAAPQLVAVTGWGQQADKQAALDAGFDRHVTKPIDLEALQRLLRAPGRPGPTPS